LKKYFGIFILLLFFASSGTYAEDWYKYVEDSPDVLYVTNITNLINFYLKSLSQFRPRFSQTAWIIYREFLRTFILLLGKQKNRKYNTGDRYVCLANMRSLEGAIEMYDMDREENTPLPDIILAPSPSNLAKKLLELNYIYKIPQCPAGGTITWISKIRKCRCSVHGESSAKLITWKRRIPPVTVTEKDMDKLVEKIIFALKEIKGSDFLKVNTLCAYLRFSRFHGTLPGIVVILEGRIDVEKSLKFVSDKLDELFNWLNEVESGYTFPERSLAKKIKLLTKVVKKKRGKFFIYTLPDLSISIGVLNNKLAIITDTKNIAYAIKEHKFNISDVKGFINLLGLTRQPEFFKVLKLNLANIFLSGGIIGQLGILVIPEGISLAWAGGDFIVRMKFSNNIELAKAYTMLNTLLPLKKMALTAEIDKYTELLKTEKNQKKIKILKFKKENFKMAVDILKYLKIDKELSYIILTLPLKDVNFLNTPLLNMLRALFAIVSGELNRLRGRAARQACVCNMKSLEGAVEMYDMDRSDNAPLPDIVFSPNPDALAKKLLKLKYIHKIPKCRAGGTIRWISKTRECECSVHGKVKTPR